MKAEKLYESLENEFQLHERREDEWSSFDLGSYVTENFKSRLMGLVLDNSEEINKVFTAVFPSEPVLDTIFSRKEQGVLLFTHHPMIWDRNVEGFPMRNIPEKNLERMKDLAVSLYTLHVPLDQNGPYGTSASFARALKVEKESEFFDYHGATVGIVGSTSCVNLEELTRLAQDIVGHKVKTWDYGGPLIKNQKVAVIGGGGNFPEVLEELLDTDVRTYVTGVTRANKEWEPSLRFHNLAKEHGFNMIGTTHYSSEKFACIAIQKFFQHLGLPTEFIEGIPEFQDLE